MDAKVLRSALSAAIKVTVSTALIGCGGTVSNDPSRTASAPDSSDSGAGSVGQATPSASGHAGASYVASSTTGGYPSTGAAATMPGAAGSNGGMAENGGAAVGGTASGVGGESSSAGAASDMCASAADACLTMLEQRPAAEPASEADQACCDTVVTELDTLKEAKSACYPDLYRRFMMGEVRPRCCTDPATWVHEACAPWGPPVPPELPAALREWSGWS